MLDWLMFFLQLDKLVVSQTGLLAQRRLARGVRLNHTEATVSFLKLIHETSLLAIKINTSTKALIANNLQEVSELTPGRDTHLPSNHIYSSSSAMAITQSQISCPLEHRCSDVDMFYLQSYPP